ncbi:stemmadenine O-acetyltransferase-like [Prosopis cineraria]|uniref:stemmadenine O-acetyltransferase-like n=1 Tax=Prosopis cineraria TaxID=364024 RepID=UPI00240FE1F2|nr:stemmadenine O-acetyltransferase-like [Prosopis cineraria]
MEVRIISTHCIKPSHLTPQDLKSHNLSLLDHFVPPIYIPMILFYTDATLDGHHRLHLLCQSLSETLTLFYPFAGTINDKLFVDCDDRGIPFSEAKANSTLAHFFNQPNLASSLHKLLPVQPTWDESSQGVHVAAIRVTAFECGALTVGAIVSHMIADGAATSFFLKSWAATARKANDHHPSPNFEAPPVIFPDKADVLPKHAGIMALCGRFIKRGKTVTRRLRFGASAMAKLTAEGSSSRVPNPTRVEVVSALIWKSMTAALKSDSVLISHAVNMRRRAVPAFSEGYMGNFLWAAPALSRGVELLPELVIKIRESITKIDADLVKSLQGEGGSVRYCEALGEMAGEAAGGEAYVGYSSWCGFGLYDVDFGWGKPAWVACTGSTGDEALSFNAVVLVDTPSGHGIEAWLYLPPDDMAMLEQDKDLLAFATLDPHPLETNAPSLY